MTGQYYSSTQNVNANMLKVYQQKFNKFGKKQQLCHCMGVGNDRNEHCIPLEIT